MPPKVLVRRFHKSRDSAFACAHSALVGCSACGLLLPPLPRPCCWHASGHAAMRLARKTTARLLERACAMPSLCDHDTFAVFARRVLHVSAGRRRGAAAYGSDFRLLSEARTHGCHRSRRYPGLSSRLAWHDFEKSRSRTLLRSASLTHHPPSLPYFSADLSPHDDRPFTPPVAAPGILWNVARHGTERRGETWE